MHKETLWMAIMGINRELHRREVIIWNMRAYLKDPVKSSAQYSFRYIYSNGPRIMHEIRRLKIIKVELFYLYNLKLLGV